MDVFTRTDAEGQSGVQAFRLSHETYGVCRGSVRADSKRKTHKIKYDTLGHKCKAFTTKKEAPDGAQVINTSCLQQRGNA